jgi:hypothetical protein
MNLFQHLNIKGYVGRNKGSQKSQVPITNPTSIERKGSHKMRKSITYVNLKLERMNLPNIHYKEKTF